MLDSAIYHGRWQQAYAVLNRMVELGLVVVDGKTVTITRAGRALAEKTDKRDA